MKLAVTITSIILLTVGFYSFLNWDKKTQIYNVDVPPGLDTMDYHASIQLNPTKQIHKVNFPRGGTETNVYIYDSTYLDNIQNNTLPMTQPLAHGDFTTQQEVLLDITSLSPGKYYIHYLSCNFGGIFSLTIKK